MPRNVLKGGHGFFTRRGLNVKAFQEAIKVELKAEHAKMADEIIPEFDKRVQDWSSESKPTFYKRVYSANVRRSGFGIYAGGSELQKGRWEMVDKGLERGQKVFRYRTTVRNGEVVASPVMHFRVKYFGKTRPVNQYGMRQTRRPPWVRPLEITLGDIEARDFTISIMDEKVRSQFLHRSKQAYDRAFKRAQRKSKSS